MYESEDFLAALAGYLPLNPDRVLAFVRGEDDPKQVASLECLPDDGDGGGFAYLYRIPGCARPADGTEPYGQTWAIVCWGLGREDVYTYETEWWGARGLEKLRRCASPTRRREHHTRRRGTSNTSEVALAPSRTSAGPLMYRCCGQVALRRQPGRDLNTS